MDASAGTRHVSPTVTARAPAKLNLFLRVGAPQHDGYHDIATLYQALTLTDDVTAAPADDFTVRFTGPVDCSGLPDDDREQCVRAARALAAVTGYRGGVHLTVTKRVPIAGGLGGGSADAAATLLVCDELWGTGLGRSGLRALAAELGADVPFALEGGTAVGTGRGDQLSPALAQGEFHWVLALSEPGLCAPEVYAALDRHREQHARALPRIPENVRVDPGALQAVRSGDRIALAEHLHNDLQAAALRLAPGLCDTLERGEAHGALAGIVAGSGPSCAFLVADAREAAELQRAFARVGTDALVVTGPAPGARLIPVRGRRTRGAQQQPGS